MIKNDWTNEDSSTMMEEKEDKMEKVNAVIYARYSSDSQTEQSIEGQLRVCRDYASRNNLNITHEYIDRAMTGRSDDRPDFQKMLQDSKKKNFKYVLVYKLDRFARNRYQSVINKKFLNDNGVGLLSATEAITDTPEGRMMEGIIESFNEFYSAELSQKVKRGNHESRLKGFVTGGTPLFGFDVVDKKYVPNLKEVAVVRRAFNDYLNGVLMKDIAKNLQKEGYKDKRGNYLIPSRISFMLNNRKYIGEYVINGVNYPNMVQPIIDRETFFRVQEKMERLKWKPGRNHGKMIFPLTTKCYCGHCGKGIIGSSGTDYGKNRRYYYKCSTKNIKATQCPTPYYRKADLEDTITYELIKKISNKEFIDLLATETCELYNQQIINNPELLVLRESLKDVEKRITNFTNAIGNGFFNDTIIQAIEKANVEKEEIMKKINVLEKVEEKPLTKNEVIEYFTKFSKSKVKDLKDVEHLYELLIDRVIVYDNHDIIIICKTLNKRYEKNYSSNSSLSSQNSEKYYKLGDVSKNPLNTMYLEIFPSDEEKKCFSLENKKDSNTLEPLLTSDGGSSQN